MPVVQFDVPYSDPRNRLTVAFRIILAFPHLIVLSAWGYVIEVLAVVHWFIQVFTGKRNKGIFDFTNRWLAYMARVYPYTGLMFDEYPGFIDDNEKTPVQFAFDYTEDVDRKTAGLRFIWAIPALILAALIGIAVWFVTLIAWFAILFTATMPRGMYDFVLKGFRYIFQVYSYLFLATDTYPKYG